MFAAALWQPQRQTDADTQQQAAVDEHPVLSKRELPNEKLKREKPHHRHHQCTHRHRQRHTDKALCQQSSATTASVAAIGAMLAYGALRGGIKAFHLSRRTFLRQLLLDLCPALDASGCTYWLDFGSLLGIYRDGDLILHDNDVDLAVLDVDWEQLIPHLQRHLPQYGFRLVYPSECPSCCFARAYCPLGMADLFGAVAKDDGRLLVDCGHGDTTAIAAEVVLPTASMQWRGTSLREPKDVERALHMRYGQTWREPRYMDKGADTMEQDKTYARVFRALSRFGIRF